jgi:biopolymer transport protein ExbD
MARGMRKYMDRRIPQTFKIQITSMVDMFVILLVFLLKSYSTSPVTVNPTKDLMLPTSTSSTEPVDIIKMVVSKKGIFIEDKKIIEFNSQLQLPSKDTDATDPMAIQPLFRELEAKANLVRNIASVNDKVVFDGKILVQADRDMPYSLLQKVLYTAMLTGYSDVKFAVLSRD